MLKYKIQLTELESELRILEPEIKNTKIEMQILDEKDITSGFKFEKIQGLLKKSKKRRRKIKTLIHKKRKALYGGKINPNAHRDYNLNRDEFVTEVQDLIAKGLMFDMIGLSSIVNPNELFGITKLGRWYISLID